VTVLSDGTKLADLSADDLNALVAHARANKPKSVPRAPSKRKSEPQRCIISSHTGACTRCGGPGGEDCQPMPNGIDFTDDADVRRFILGRAGSPALVKLVRRYAR
jgi:hypothetical protein